MANNSSTQAPEQPHAPGLEQKQLDVFLGKWKTEGKQYDGPFGPGAEFRAEETFEWLTGGFFLVHRLDGRFGSNEAACIELFRYDEATKSYPSHAYYNDGSDGEWESHVSGDTWTLTGSQGENGSMKVRCITVFSDAGEARSGKWEYSKDESGWQVFLDSTATKVS